LIGFSQRGAKLQRLSFATPYTPGSFACLSGTGGREKAKAFIKRHSSRKQEIKPTTLEPLNYWNL